MMSTDERCSGSFLDKDHPSGVPPFDEAKFEEQWRSEMREHGIPEDKITDIWEAGQKAGREAARAARGETR
jgi:hypothetical protein